MRYLPIAIVIWFAAPARAQGVYIEESIGGSSFKGELAHYGSGAPRVQIGLGIRSGVWTVELLGGATVPDLFFIDCYGDECTDDGRTGSYAYYGVDVRHAWPLHRRRWSRAGASVVLHAGPRYFAGGDALTGYRGPGVNVGAGLEGDLWLLGYFLDFGIDAMWMQMPADHVVGTAPYVMFGGKLGWL